ncbi:hypothetical protein HMPREF2909_08510 [Alloscardovia sp. HMSC034E08]|nr:hypothetical protein HMPREF2909_08510 [Alloscardovia sp. HMSC034E08]
MSDFAIELQDFTLTSSSSPTPLLENASLGFSWGTMTLLYGESGCGKTSLLNCLTGLAHNSTHLAASGILTIDGENALDWTAEQVSSHISCVLQNPDSQIIHGRVGDEIAFSLENRGVSADSIRSKVHELCEMLDLDPLAETATLSGGEKESVCIASALACERKILILDEPLASLGAHGARVVLSALRSLADSGYCVIVCEYRISTLADYVDRAVAMSGDCIREIASVALKTQIAEFMDDYDVEPAGSEQGGSLVASVSDVRVTTRDGREILSVDSLELRQREVMLLVGDNGSGKTTLLNVLASVQRVKRPGRVRVDSSGLVWQNPGYQIFSNTVDGEMALRCDSAEVCERELTALGLSGLEDRHPLSLSEGQKRRLLCAATWAAQPELILMDEPFAGQDSANIARQLEELQRLASEHNSCVVLSTHDVRGVVELVTRVIHLDCGRIVRDTINL